MLRENIRHLKKMNWILRVAAKCEETIRWNSNVYEDETGWQEVRWTSMDMKEDGKMLYEQVYNKKEL